MGKAMSALASTAIAPLRNYNIEQRAQKIISQNKPKPAPKFESDKKELERILKEHPEILEETAKKDKGLDDRLKQVFVTTSHIVDQKRPVNPDRPLPTSTEHAGFFELGFKETEPEFIPPGKISLRQVIKFIEDYKVNGDVWTKEKIASEYNLNPVDVENIIEHYHLFIVHIPAKGEEKKHTLLRLGYETQTFDKYLKLLKDKTGATTTLSEYFRKNNEKENRK